MLIENLTDVPIPEDAQISLYRYRDFSTGNVMAFTSVAFNDTRYIASKTAEVQLLNKLGLSVKAIESMPWWERDKVLEEAHRTRWAKGRLQLIMRVMGSSIMAVVTVAYLPVRHTMIWKTIEECLNQSMFEYKRFKPINASETIVTRYLLELNKGIWVSNSTKGISSIAVGRCSYIPDSNGFVMYPTDSRISHMGQIESVEDKLRSSIYELVSNMDSYINFERVFDTMYNGKILAKLDIANKYKGYLSKQTYHSLFGFIATLVEVAQIAPPKTRLGMERLAYKIIQAEVEKKELKHWDSV